MAVYKWQGVSPSGETLKGEMEATSREAVIIRLRTQRIQPKPEKIKEKGKGLDYEIKLPSFGSPVKAHDVVIFTRQFATMIDAGLPIVQCLQILAAQAEPQAVPQGHRRDQGRRRVRHDARRGDPQAPQGLLRPLRQHGRRPARSAASSTPSSSASPTTWRRRAAEEQDQGRDDLPGLHRRRPRSSSPAILLIWVIPVFARGLLELRRRRCRRRRSSSSTSRTSPSTYFWFLAR